VPSDLDRAIRERLAKDRYDAAMIDRDVHVYGYSWTPWEDLDADDRDYWMDAIDDAASLGVAGERKEDETHG
jgi:hypothetical protein